MAWHLFSVPTAVGDEASDFECRIDSELYEQLIERDMWDRVTDKLAEILPRLNETELRERYEEFELFDLFDVSTILAVRFCRTVQVWDLFEVDSADIVLGDDDGEANSDDA